MDSNISKKRDQFTRSISDLKVDKNLSLSTKFHWMPLALAIYLLMLGSVAIAEKITLDIFATYEGVETKAGYMMYDTDLYVGELWGQEFYELVSLTFTSPATGNTYTLDEATALNGIPSYGSTDVLAEATSSSVGVMDLKDVETLRYLEFSPFPDEETGEVAWRESLFPIGPLGTYELRPQTAAFDPFECYRAETSSDSEFQERQVVLEDQFGISAPIVMSPRFLCNPVSVDGETITNQETHMVCYLLVKDTNVESYVEVVTNDDFGELLLEVSNSRLLCMPAKMEATDIDNQ